MTTIDDIPAALAATTQAVILAVTEGEVLSAKVIAESAAVSPVDRICRLAEMLYAERAGISQAALLVTAAQLAEFGGRWGWHGLAENGRALGMMAALLREAGEPAPEGGWPDPEADPEILAEFAPPPPAPAAEQAPGPA